MISQNILQKVLYLFDIEDESEKVQTPLEINLEILKKINTD